jgi:asparagine synthase (glutamine-hydrolysing)
MLVGAASGLAKLSAGFAQGVLRSRLERFAYMTAGRREENIRRLFHFTPLDVVRPVAGERLADGVVPSKWLDSGLAETAGAPILERVLAGEFLGFLPDHNLAYTDKASMAESVEVRVPLLDSRIVAFASRLHPSLKMRRGQPKHFFKQAMSDRLPASILHRKKTGFGAPVRSWITQGKLHEPFMDILRSRVFRERGLFDGPAVEALFHNTCKHNIDGAYLLLIIVLIELWCRQFEGRHQHAMQRSA